MTADTRTDAAATTDHIVASARAQLGLSYDATPSSRPLEELAH